MSRSDLPPCPAREARCPPTRAAMCDPSPLRVGMGGLRPRGTFGHTSWFANTRILDYRFVVRCLSRCRGRHTVACPRNKGGNCTATRRTAASSADWRARGTAPPRTAYTTETKPFYLTSEFVLYVLYEMGLGI